MPEFNLGVLFSFIYVVYVINLCLLLPVVFIFPSAGTNPFVWSHRAENTNFIEPEDL